MEIIHYNHIFNRYILKELDFLKVSYLPILKNQIEEQSFHPIFIKEFTNRGFESDITVSDRKGIYLIYKKTDQPVLLYVGCSEACVYNRITRFIAGVKGTIREDENHPAAQKYVSVFGNDLDDLYFKFVPIEQSNLLENFSHTVFDLEQLLIEEYEPLFNEETFFKYNFKQIIPQKVFRIGNIEVHKL